jgi:hypothetical protein
VASPPLVLQWPVVEVARPQPAPIGVTAPTTQVITVAWPRVKLAGHDRPPPPEVLHLCGPSQVPFRCRLPGAMAAMLADPLPHRKPARADRPALP